MIFVLYCEKYNEGTPVSYTHLDVYKRQGRQRTVQQRQPQRRGDDLAGRRGAEKLAAAARTTARMAAQIGGFRQRNLALRKAHAQRLHLARIFACGWG